MFPFPWYCREEILFINTRNIAKIHVAWNDLSLLGMWRKLLRMLKIFWVLKETTKQRDRWIPRCVEKEDRVGGCQFGGRHKTQLACTTVSNKQAHTHLASSLPPPSSCVLNKNIQSSVWRPASDVYGESVVVLECY